MDSRIPNAARLQKQKKYPEAEQIYRQILRNQPRDPDALLLLGLLLHETARSAEAVDAMKRAITAQPGRIEIHQTLVGVLVSLGRLTEAITEAREVVRLRPTAAESHYAVAQLLLQTGDHTAALPSAVRAAELNPRSPVFLLALARVQVGLEQTAAAMATLDRALLLEPQNADLLIDKAQLLQKGGQIQSAIVLYESALQRAPANLSALNNLGSCYVLSQRPRDAIKCFGAAAVRAPTSPVPRNNVGAALKELGLIDEAIGEFEKSIQIDPNYADAWCNIGGAYAMIAEPHRAIDAFRQALKIKPDFAGVGSNLLMSTLSPPDLSPQQVYDEHVAWAGRHVGGIVNPLAPAAFDCSPDRRLRIGYVSPDFREHSVRYFIEPVVTHHDRSQFEVHCFAAGQRRDEVTDRLAKLVDHWHPIADLSDRQLAEKIRGLQIDILIDLAGHTSENRLPAFAHRPAPVQVTYLGYPTTTGMTAIDCRLTDWICDPPGAEAFYTEKLIRLPDAFFVYNDDAAKPFDPVLPADRNGCFTFGSFNSFTKFNDATLESWANILRQVPGSRLLIKAKPIDNPSTKARLLKFFADQGISSDRLDLRSWVSLAEHTALLGSGIDLMLDTFPYNGHTTSCQSIWMGVPMVTRAGESFRSRVGKVIHENLGLADLVAQTSEQYEQIAVSLATDLTQLRELRPGLRDRLTKSALCNAADFTRNLEGAYHKMWRSYCDAGSSRKT